MPDLFSPLRINGLYLKNRIFFPPMGTNFAEAGAPSLKHIAYHRERAQAGCALNMIEATYVETVKHNYRMALDDDSLVPGLARLVDAIHEGGAKAGIQFQHQGRSASPETTGCVKRYVSLIPGLTGDEKNLLITNDDMKRLIEKHVQAARRAIKAGMDLIELHGAHGFLLAQFMSPLTNRRMDDYGGSRENRMRFVLEFLEAMRAECGQAFPIAMRLSADEMYEGGMTIAETEKIAQILVDNGIDAISVSAAIRESYEYAIPPAIVPEGWLVDSAERIKKSINSRVPVMVAGRIKSLKLANRIITEEKADMAGIGRALIADPELIEKYRSGKTEETLPCLGCNIRCIGFLEKALPIGCAINPRTGKEHLHPLKKPRDGIGKKLVIVGAGIAGLAAAKFASDKGFDVTILEKEPVPGGLLRPASRPPHKEAYQRLLETLLAQLRKANVAIKTSTQASSENITAEKPDFVLIATGSEPAIPAFCKGNDVRLAQDVLEKPAITGEILIIGGGSVGCETAEYLQKDENQITIVEMRDEFAPDMEWRWRKMTLRNLEQAKVKFLARHRVLEIYPDKSVLLERLNDNGEVNGAFRTSPFTHIILASGYKSGETAELEKGLLENGIAYVKIGDAKNVGLVADAMEQAFLEVERI